MYPSATYPGPDGGVTRIAALAATFDGNDFVVAAGVHSSINGDYNGGAVGRFSRGPSGRVSATGFVDNRVLGFTGIASNPLGGTWTVGRSPLGALVLAKVFLFR
jgi:hypothetical protein